MHEQLRIARYFNSRPSARGDPCCVGCLQGHNDFNSRPSARGDIDIPEHDVKAGISIHAPPRGATQDVLDCVPIPQISIHAPPRGATAIKAFSLSDVDIFQFTPLREGRLRHSGRLPADAYFNSRPSARGDTAEMPRTIKYLYISIHAPPRGATKSHSRQFRRLHISIHAPPRGATPGGLRRESGRAISIHAPPRGATHTPARPARCWNFNSRPSARGDRKRSNRFG